MRSTCFLLLAAALAASTSCTTPDTIPDIQGSSFVDSNVAVNSLRNSVYDQCGWAAEPSSLRNLVPGITVGRDGFQRITNAICAAARGTPAPALPGIPSRLRSRGRWCAEGFSNRARHLRLRKTESRIHPTVQDACVPPSQSRQKLATRQLACVPGSRAMRRILVQLGCRVMTGGLNQKVYLTGFRS